jgi:hypothetical protein
VQQTRPLARDRCAGIGNNATSAKLKAKASPKPASTKKLKKMVDIKQGMRSWTGPRREAKGQPVWVRVARRRRIAARGTAKRRNLLAASKVDGGRPIAVPSGSIRNGALR